MGISKHLEIPFDDAANTKNASVQLAQNGVTITVGNLPPVFIERQYVDQFVSKWNEVRQNP